jgi:MoaA/NifB/PqqE/SkfB family radical SAM enzyme
MVPPLAVPLSGRFGGERYRAETPRPLPAFRLYRPRPGHPDWPRLEAEAREIAAAVRPRLAPPPAGWREGRRRLRSYATAARNFATNWRRARAGRDDLLPLYFIWTLCRSCNFRCAYCDDHRGRKYPDLPNEGALTTHQGRELLRIMRSATPSVYFSGGEPTLRPDLPELTRAARELAYHPIIINTNASAIHRLVAKEGWEDWLANTDIVVVSLDALDLELLHRMWVYPRPQDVLRNLLLLRALAGETRTKLMVNTVIQPGLVEHAGDVLDLANDLGIWFCPVPMNVGPTIEGALLSDPAYRALADRILERKQAGHRISGSLRMNRRLLGAEPLHCRNTLKPHVDYDGRLFWPCKASVNVEPERIQVLDFEDVESLYAHAAARIDPTGFHGPAPDQCGANCNWAQNYTTDAYAHGLAHPLSLVGEIAEFIRAR